MGKRMWAVLAGACALALVAVVPGKAQNAKGWVPYTGVKQTGFAVTPPVRSMPKASPHAGPPVQVPLLHRPAFVPSPQQPTAPDPALQTVPGAPLNAVAEPGFGGVGFNGYYPPDPNSSVGGKDSTGHEEVVETTNVEFSVYDAATGKVLSGPTSMDSLFSSLAGTLCATNNGGDPVVLWDKISQHWLISQLAYTNNLRSDEACIAISTGPDATGTYNAYGFSFSHLTDYPKYGVWSSSSTANGSDYYFSANLFSMAKYYGPVVCAFNGADMQSGKSARYACDQNMSTSDFSLLPSDSDGSTPPGQAEPNYFVELGNSSSLTMYPIVANWTSSGGSLSLQSSINIPVKTYIEACSGGGQCIPQPGTSRQLDSLGDRLMYRLAFRKSSSGESLVVNNSVDEGNGIVGIRWYEFTTTGTFNDYEARRTFSGTGANTYQGTFGPDANYRWMGSIAQDQNGDIALGYSESNGSSLYPSIYYTGTANPSSDSMGTETPLLKGTGSETGSYRWGDYSSMSVDPADDCTFWYTNEYFNANASSSVSWSTYIAPFNFNSCPTFDVSVTQGSSASATSTGAQGSSASYSIDLTAGTGFSGTVALSATDLSSGLKANQITINSGSPSVPLSAQTSATTTPVTVSVDTTGMAAGTYTFYIVGEDSSKTDGAGGALAKGLPLTLTITSGSGGGTGNFAVSASPASATITQGQTTTSKIIVTPSSGYAGTVDLQDSCPQNVGITCSLSAASLTFTGGTTPQSVNLNVTTSSTTPVTSGTPYSVTVTGTDQSNNTLTSTATFSLTVDAATTGSAYFTVAVSAQNPTTITPGQNPTFTVTVTSKNNFSGSVSLSVSGLPKFANGSFNVNPVSVSSGGTATSTLTVRTNKNVASGSTSFTVTGTSGSLTGTGTGTLSVK